MMLFVPEVEGAMAEGQKQEQNDGGDGRANAPCSIRKEKVCILEKDF